jgi:hypothetical protein
MSHFDAHQLAREQIATARAEGRLEGAAVAFGIIGMARAIAARGPWCPSRRDYWVSELDGRRYYTCWCARCERQQLKHRVAGEDEGTDEELCGDCRY